MRVCLIARNRFHGDRQAVVVSRVLSRAGHDVSVVSVDNQPAHHPVVATVPRSPRYYGRLMSSGLKRSWRDRRLAAVAIATGADVYLPLHEDVFGVAVGAARRTGGVVQRTPDMPAAPGVDLLDLAPTRPELAQPTGGMGSDFVLGPEPTPYMPEPGRYEGETAVICYRKTAANPGRYLESALVRSGFRVRVETDSIDLGSVDPASRFVLFVEGPYPAIGVEGTTPVPTFFWAHHGEHHLFPNLRLADRYRADSILLAHSWHLAYWFPTPVHRFPFGIPTELFGSSQPLRRRSFDVAMIGSKLRGDAWQYQRRTTLVAALEGHLPADRIRFVEGVSPEEMAGIYGDSRIVLNEGGIRHFPITMRIFEAIGAGAVLLTDTPPGLELLFTPGTEYLTLTDDVTGDVDRILTNLEQSQAMADRAHHHALGQHTYDHRVDQLTAIAGETEKRELAPSSVATGLARMIDADVEVQRLIHNDIESLDEELADREVWPLAERKGRLRRGNMDAAAIATDDVAGLEPLLDSARRYIYAEGDVAGLDDYLQVHHPEAVSQWDGKLRRIDLMTEAYRVKAAGSRP